MTTFSQVGSALVVAHEREVLQIEPWGRDSVRVRAAIGSLPEADHGALEATAPAGADALIKIDGDSAQVVNGQVTVEVRLDVDAEPLLRFVRSGTDEELLAEQREHFWWPGARVYYGNGSGAAEIHQQFQAYPGERLYGMGQRTHGRLNHKGLALDLLQRNAEVSIPFVVSNRGYGLLWNNPAIGRVEFAENATRWQANQARGIDYYFTTGSPSEILANYADATGHAPRLPQWASGFWQSKLRYRNQQELMEVVREHKRRGLPLSVIVTDFFHWTAMGDYRLDPQQYPDPAAMMAELADLDVRLMVSIWPTVSPLSENYQALNEGGMLLGAEAGLGFHASIRDVGMAVAMPVAFYDPTNPQTREFIWSKVKRNYYDLGVRVWWLDACEPEVRPGDLAHLSFHAGPGAEVANIYPRDNARLFAEGMAGTVAQTGDPAEAETVLLCRSAWAGQQKYPAAVWSGDIPATWDSLRTQIRAGLSIAMAGIPWWTTDIGGFHGGNPDDPDYRELMVRWFQFGAFCPLFRLHGDREPRTQVGWTMTGGPNEVWSFGEEAFEIISGVLAMRERLRPYLHEQLDIAAERGLPAMRPLFVDFPADATAWTVEDQFLFGTDVLVAPVAHAGVLEREVYLPAGADWTDVWTGHVHPGGQTVTAAAPLHLIPVYRRDGAEVPVAGGRQQPESA